MNITNSRVIGTGKPSPTFNILLTIRFFNANKRSKAEHEPAARASPLYFPLRDIAFVSIAFTAEMAEAFAS